jgi:hypothetical protein
METTQPVTPEQIAALEEMIEILRRNPAYVTALIRWDDAREALAAEMAK